MIDDVFHNVLHTIECFQPTIWGPRACPLQEIEVDMCYWDTFLSAPTSSSMRNMHLMRWSANPNHARSDLPHNFGAHMNILFIIKVWILALVKWLYSPLTMLTIENPRMVSIFWAFSPISFWYLFLVPHLTIYHSLGVQIITMLDLGMSTLDASQLVHGRPRSL